MRTRVLRKGYKSSEYTKFLDYFEHVYLKKEEKTWRHKYSLIYNSKIYFIGSVLTVLCMEILGIFCLVFEYLSVGGIR